METERWDSAHQGELKQRLMSRAWPCGEIPALCSPPKHSDPCSSVSAEHFPAGLGPSCAGSYPQPGTALRPPDFCHHH